VIYTGGIRHAQESQFPGTLGRAEGLVKHMIPLEALCSPVAPHAVGDLLIRAGFDPEQYRNAHPDLQAAFSDSWGSTAHFMHSGFAEGRTYPAKVDLDGMRELFSASICNQTYVGHLASGLSRLGFAIRGEPADAMSVASASWNGPAIGGVPVLVIGDSHARLCTCPTARRDHWIIPIHAVLPAATASALRDKNARAGYGVRVATVLRIAHEIGWRPEHPILLKFGQHDVEFASTFDRLRRGASRYGPTECEEFCATSVEQYRSFLEETVPTLLRRSVMILSTFPPALSDDVWGRGVLDLRVIPLHSGLSSDEMAERIRQAEIPDIFERTRMHRFYNRLLSEMAEQLGIDYLDVMEDLLSPLGIVAPQYLTEIDNDHHLSWPHAGPVITAAIWHALEQRDLRPA
jgi:hypothetical protein